MFPGTRAFITAKMEGQSFTCSLDPKKKYEFYVCSRNNRLVRGQSDSTVFYNTADRYDIAKKLKDYYKRTGHLLIIQGEQVGPTIQENIYNFKEVQWFVFRMKEYVDGKWVERNYADMEPIISALGLQRVPLLEVVEDMGKFDTVESLVKYAEGIYYKPYPDGTTDFHYVPKQGERLWKDYLMSEGIVVKSEDYDKEKGKGFSFKVKNLQYAEKGLKEIAKVCRELEAKK